YQCRKAGNKVQRLEKYVSRSISITAFDEKNRELNETSRKGLIKLSSNYNGTSFIPRSSLPELSKVDFVDSYHVKDAVGLTYVKSILEYHANM
ncbi:MAG: hypothetical protein QNL62_02405, partial [Gammaproteobacteria bacterium]|nr:hypothetical protein [Gammaproteobacteria bacterium]